MRGCWLWYHLASHCEDQPNIIQPCPIISVKHTYSTVLLLYRVSTYRSPPRSYYASLSSVGVCRGSNVLRVRGACMVGYSRNCRSYADEMPTTLWWRLEVDVASMLTRKKQDGTNVISNLNTMRPSLLIISYFFVLRLIRCFAQHKLTYKFNYSST